MNSMKHFLSPTLSCITLVGIMLSAVGCGPKSFDDPDELLAYVRADSSPYVQEITQGDVRFRIRYVPVDARMAAHYRRPEEGPNQSEQRQTEESDVVVQADGPALSEGVVRADFEPTLQFVLEITPIEEGRDLVFDRMASGYGDYSRWIQALLFELQGKIHLETPAVDDVPLSAYHMERSYGLSPGRSFILTFPARVGETELADEDWIRIHIGEFGLRTGSVAAEFDMPFPAVRLHLPTS